MISNKNVANAVGGKTTRACDSCIKKRARWYCAADDAFLCQACDSSVHSANPLARRHERVRLKTSSLKPLDISPKKTSLPCWHRGFTRKARTPRHAKPVSQSKSEEKSKNQTVPFVPELGSDEISHEENEEEQLLYRVPVFDPSVAELCTSATVSNEAETTTTGADVNGIESKQCLVWDRRQYVENLHGFLPSDMDLADFAADVENLLGRGLENESFRMEELGLADCKEEQLHSVKIEDEEKEEQEEEDDDDENDDKAIKERHIDTEIDMGKEPPFELNFDYDSATCGEEDEKAGIGGKRELKNSITENEDEVEQNKKNKKKKKRKILLSLDYEAIISAWASQGSPWTTGHRPDIDPDECWPDWMGNWGGEVEQVYGGGRGQYGVIGGEGREARVSRYREKRRTRLFSKKIRYEVRKLNAEKRPRMKGRFVKRTTFASSTPPFSLHPK